MKITITNTLSAAFLGYMAYTLWTISTLFSPNLCKAGSRTCITPYTGDFKLQVYSFTRSHHQNQKQLTLLWECSNFTIDDTTTKTINVSIPLTTRRNGSLYVYAMVFPRDHDPKKSKHVTVAESSLTTYMVPQSTFFSLLTNGEKKNETKKEENLLPFTHFRNKLRVSVMSGQVVLDRTQVPSEIYPFVRIVEGGHFLPIVYIDELSNRVRDLSLINQTSTTMPLDVTYTPISVGKLRLFVQMQQSFKMLQSLGFSEKDIDEVKGIFADTNLYFLLLTFAVSTLHLLFDALAFKNDISYWKDRRSMIGLSSRAVVWRCVSTIIIFFYLLDADTSLLVLIPTGIGSLIEIWKVTKAFKVKIVWTGRLPSFQLGSPSEQEQLTQQFDTQAMSYLSKLLYPLCIGGAVYSLVYIQHKSWVSWTLQSLVNGVYAFGFLFMLPQLFVNYKLKSVAHLPWRAFMYKAFNTFIDDIFAFIITMPTSHRLACFRDDLVFVVYLYQRWLYPVDKKRVNEYGMSFDKEAKSDDKKDQ